MLTVLAKFILFSSFFLFFILRFLARTSQIVKEYNLYSSELEKFKMGFRIGEMKQKLKKTNDAYIKNEIKKSIKFLRASNWCIFFLLFSYLYIVFNP